MQGWRFDTKGLSSSSVTWNGEAHTHQPVLVFTAGAVLHLAFT